MWGFVLLACVFVFPQLLGVLLYYRMHWAPRWVARTASILAPAVIFFFLAPILFFSGMREAEPGGCGMPAAFAGLFLLFGIGVQLVPGIVTHAILATGRK
jgi:hypothetical protein